MSNQVIKISNIVESSEYSRTKESLAASVSELITNTNNIKDHFIKASKDQENQIKVNIKGIVSEISSGAPIQRWQFTIYNSTIFQP